MKILAVYGSPDRGGDWYQLSGRMKTFIDRWSDTINPDFSSDLEGKGWLSCRPTRD